MKNILELLREEVTSGMITIRRAAEMLCRAGWTNYVDEDATRKLLNLEDTK